jgi:hypothetical protein
VPGGVERLIEGPSGGGELRLRAGGDGVGGDEADGGFAAAGDDEFLAGDRPLHVPAEVVAEFVGADGLFARVGGVELVGLEPTTFRMPSERSPS